MPFSIQIFRSNGKSDSGSFWSSQFSSGCIFSQASLTSGMLESLAWVSSKLLNVTEAEARSQQLLHPVQPSSQVASQPMCQRENTATMSCRSYPIYPIEGWLQALKLAVLPS